MDFEVLPEKESKNTRENLVFSRKIIEAKKDDVQWSLGGTLGVEYRFIPQLGLYAEPGVRYYFDNGSNVQNYFKDVPTSWSLQFGVHLHLGQSK